jgi:hypothetical protein
LESRFLMQNIIRVMVVVYRLHVFVAVVNRDLVMVQVS